MCCVKVAGNQSLHEYGGPMGASLDWFWNKVFWHSGHLNDLINMDVQSSKTLPEILLQRNRNLSAE